MSATVNANSQVQSGAALLGLEIRNWEPGGVQIVRTAPDGAAALAGLHAGDVINSVNGKRIGTTADFERVVSSKLQDSTVKIRYLFHTNLGWMPGAEKVLTMHQ